VIRLAVIPALQSAGWRVADPRETQPGTRFFDEIARAIRSSDLVIAELSRMNQNVLYELGLAHGWGKDTVVLSQRLERIPFDVASRYHVLVYSDEEPSVTAIRGRLEHLFSEIERAPRSLADPAIDRIVDLNSTLAVELLSEQASAIQLTQYLSSLLSTLNQVSPLPDATFQEVRTGSLGAWISTEIGSLVSLIEKIIFFLPEWRRRDVERVRIEAETELLQAQARLTRAQADEVRRESDRRDAALLLKVIQKSRSLGPMRLTLADRLQIETDDDGIVTVGPSPALPERRHKNT
jgi:hypothetical protein